MTRRKKKTEPERLAYLRKLYKEKSEAYYAARNTPVVMLPDALPGGLLSLADAVAGGVSWYRTGDVLPCGHAGWQYVSTGRCRACGIAAARCAGWLV